MALADRPIASTEHVTAAVVAAAVIALALPSGSTSTSLMAGISIAVWWLVIVAVVVRLFPAAQIPRGASVAGLSLLGLALLSALSALWANDAGRAFASAITVSLYLGIFVLVVIASRPGTARSWLTGLVLGLVGIGVIAIAPRYFPGVFGAPDQEAFADLATAGGRLGFPIGYWNGLAACLALGIVGLLWLSATSTERASRLIWAALVPPSALALYLTASRGGLVALAVGVATLLIASSQRGRVAVLTGITGAIGVALSALASTQDAFADGLATGAADADGLLMLGATIIGCGLTVAALIFLEPWLSRLELPRRPTVICLGVIAVVAIVVVIVTSGDLLGGGNDLPTAGPSGGVEGLARTGTSGRSQFWGAAVDAFAGEPLAGVGAGNYDLYWNTHNTLSIAVRNAHSLYLESLAELGIWGLLLVLGFLLTPLWVGFKQARDGDPQVAGALALLVVGVVTAAFEWTWQIPASFVAVVVVAGLLAGPALAPSPERRRDQFGLGALAIAVGWVSIWMAAVVLITEVKLNESRDAVAAGALDAAAQAARDAHVVQPWSPEPSLQLAQVEALRGAPAAAHTAADEAIDRASDDYRVWIVAARIDAARGDEEQARLDLNRARDISPRALPLRVFEPQ